jgi:hypothetical protein
MTGVGRLWRGLAAGLALVAVMLALPAAAAESRKAPNQQGGSEGAADAALASGLYRIEGLEQNGTAFYGMVAATRSRGGFDLTAWIGSRKVAGEAHVGRGPLEVAWDGETTTYEPAADGTLGGGWPGGGASTLTPFARADVSAPPPGGRYEVEGRNPGEGGGYRGIMTLEREGEGYKVTWQINGSAIPGTATFLDGVLVIEYGAANPAIYALAADGSLTGLWAGGAGSEVLKPIP